MLHFQNKDIHFTLTNIFYFHNLMIEAKKEYVKIRHMKSGNISDKLHCGIF